MNKPNDEVLLRFSARGRPEARALERTPPTERLIAARSRRSGSELSQEYRRFELEKLLNGDK